MPHANSLSFVTTGIILVLLIPIPAISQSTLTGAMLFAANASGGDTNQAEWNALGNDGYWNLWFALNPDATSPVNGPSDAQAGIVLPLLPGNSYKYYTFAQSNGSTPAYTDSTYFLTVTTIIREFRFLERSTALDSRRTA